MSSSSSSTPSLWPPDSRHRIERERCRRDPARFIHTCCWLDTEPEWKPFRLWDAQRSTLADFEAHRRVVVLKARQLGLTWLSLGYALWLMLFRPGTTVLFFSKDDDAAKEMLRRLKGMVERLPAWLRPALAAPTNTEELTLENASNAKSFPSTGGRSYTASLAVMDEADWLAPDERSPLDKLPAMLDAVKPTVDAGGKLILLSTSRKPQPESLFKKIYRAAKRGEGGYHPVFLPWSARPDRTPAWYAGQSADFLATDGSLDRLHQEYPATDAEALTPRALDKRLAPAWLERCYAEARPLPDPDARFPSLPGLEVYAAPLRGRDYVIGADPAQGNPQSDDSAAEVLDCVTGEQVASIGGRSEMAVFGSMLDAVGRWYNHAPVLCERNNHGHAVLLWLREHSGLRRLAGHDGQEGWNTSSSLQKARLYDTCADALRNGEVTLHALATFAQLAAVDGTTLNAPSGQHDDRAVAYALACAARLQLARSDGPIVTEPPQQTLMGALANRAW
jgi:hypothetical protein